MERCKQCYEPCPKCGATSTPTEYAGGDEWPPNICKQAFVQGREFRVLYTCPVHGDFGLAPDGPFFAEPDTWVRGPHGRWAFQR